MEVDEMRACDVTSCGRSADEAEEDERSQPSEVYLSVLWMSGSKLGVAYYDASTCHLHLLPANTADYPPSFLNLSKVLRLSRPRVVLAMNKQDEIFLNAVKKMVDEIDGEMSGAESVTGSSANCALHVMPSVDFDLSSCRWRLLHLKLPQMPTFTDDASRTVYMSDLFNFNDVALVRSAGALLKYLERKRVNVELEGGDVTTPIVAVKTITLADVVNVDRDSYKALQIFKKERHPSVYKMSGGGREGFSLFGVFSQCKSFLGNQEMERMFLQPTRNLDVISQRHLAINFLLHPNNEELVFMFQNHLKSISNVTKIVTNMKGGKTSVKEWQKLYDTVYHAARLAELCHKSKLPPQINIFQNIIDSFKSDLLKMATYIDTVIDFPESHAARRFVVKQGVSSALDQKKQTYDGLPDLLTVVAERELELLSADVDECNVVYLPQLGYLLAIPVTERMRSTDDYQLPNLTFTFASNDIIYYKSKFTSDLDKSLGDTHNEILDVELGIMLELQREVLQLSDVLLDVMRYSAQLDCLIAMAKVAKEFSYTQPTVNHGGVICIKKGRHPLLEMRCATYVPNDVISGGADGSKMLFLTGPNSSGKSVYLKQVALIVFLAHIGSFVPAESAVIGAVDAIFTRAFTLESVSIGLSTFMTELNQISLAVRHANARSLVIIDEFGKGTSAVDGLALLAATLNYWLDRPHDCPHIFVSTHIYGVIKYLRQTKLIKFKTFETLLEGEELVYLYRLIDGVGSISYASLVAKKAGFSQEDVARSLEVTKALCEAKMIPKRLDFRNQIYKRARKEVEMFLQLDVNNAEEVQKYFDQMRVELDKEEAGSSAVKVRECEEENPLPGCSNDSQNTN